MLSATIPFEIHLTTINLVETQLDTFLRVCELAEGKPLLIELSKGNVVQQPMLSKVVKAAALEEAFYAANDLSAILHQHGFAVKRLKIEVPANRWEAFTDLSTAFPRYFEWHGKLLFTEPEQLLRLCDEHQVHLSKNALKDEHHTRFVTLREYGNYDRFQARIKLLATALAHQGRELLKQEAEYCVYDNNMGFDDGWLPQ